MLTYFVIGLVVTAIALEFLGPVILQKFFPQALVAPAPEVEIRPKRAAAREAMVDEAMSEVQNPQSPLNPLSRNAALATAVPASAALVSVSGASTDEALVLAGAEADFDYDDYRTAGSSPVAAMQADSAAVAAPAANAQQVEVIQGIPDVFEDDAAQTA